MFGGHFILWFSDFQIILQVSILANSNLRHSVNNYFCEILILQGFYLASYCKNKRLTKKCFNCSINIQRNKSEAWKVFSWAARNIPAVPQRLPYNPKTAKKTQKHDKNTFPRKPINQEKHLQICMVHLSFTGKAMKQQRVER